MKKYIKISIAIILSVVSILYLISWIPRTKKNISKTEEKILCKELDVSSLPPHAHIEKIKYTSTIFNEELIIQIKNFQSISDAETWFENEMDLEHYVKNEKKYDEGEKVELLENESSNYENIDGNWVPAFNYTVRIPSVNRPDLKYHIIANLYKDNDKYTIEIETAPNTKEVKSMVRFFFPKRYK